LQARWWAGLMASACAVAMIVWLWPDSTRRTPVVDLKEVQRG